MTPLGHRAAVGHPWLGFSCRAIVVGVEGSPSLKEFVSARVEEGIVLARLAISAHPRVAAGGQGAGVARATLVTEALDRRELLALADTADHDASNPDAWRTGISVPSARQSRSRPVS